MPDPAGPFEEAVRAATEALTPYMARWKAMRVAPEILAAALPHLRDAIAADLHTALRDAIELAAEGISYTNGYFREKWGMDDELARLKAVLATRIARSPQPGDTAAGDRP